MTVALTGAFLMLPDGPRRLTLRIGRSSIASLGGSPQPGDGVFDLNGYAIFPGLINGYDRLDWNVFTAVKLRDRYDDAVEWYADLSDALQSRKLARLSALPHADKLFSGGLKNLLSGATTVLHQGPHDRSLDARWFPVKTVARYGWSDERHSDAEIGASFDATPPDAPWLIRIAEGFTDESEKGLFRIDQLGCLVENSVIVHGLGMLPEDMDRLLETGAGLVWCPTSNLYLLGETRFREPLLSRIALGTGPRVAGSTDLFAEMKRAQSESGLSARLITQMVTTDAARLLRLPDAGRLRPGGAADLIIIRLGDEGPYEALLRARRTDLSMVLVDGEPQIGDVRFKPLFKQLSTATASAELDGVPKLMSRSLARQILKRQVPEHGLRL
ncbi:MAG: amidohydrolase family protein [Chloroflexi bacterium]|nr:amidohydrolase family protein [Chloroflexota bacterium]